MRVLYINIAFYENTHIFQNRMLLRRVALFYIFANIFMSGLIEGSWILNICFFIQSCNITSCSLWKTPPYTPEHVTVKKTNCFLVL